MKAKFLSLAACAFLFQNCTKSPETSSISQTPEKIIPNAGCVSNPIIDEAGGDPFCIKYNGTYYMYRPEDNTVVYNTSTDLINWSATATMNFAPGTPVWAPEVHQVGSNLYIYYANPNGVNGGRDVMSCKLSSPTSAGSNTPVNLVGANTDEINIDPTVFNEGSDYYLLWKNVGNGPDDHSRIRIRKLSSTNGTQFASGSSQSVLFPDVAGVPLNKEHPTLIRQDYGTNSSRYFLFFDSGQGDTQDYKVNWATSSSLMGTYTYKGVLMEKDASRNIYSIGGHSIVRDGSNYRWMVYRAKNTSADGWGGRKPCIDRLFIDATANTATCEPTRTQSTYCPDPL